MGLGQKMMSLVLAEAFRHRGASRVSLVVFPDNHAAIACYLAAGLIDVGEQRKYFQTTGAQHVMRQMSIDTRGYAVHSQAC